MRKLIFLMSLFIASPAFSAFTYSRKIIIDHTKVNTFDQSNFPVLFSSGTFSSTLANVGSGGHVQNINGFDIGFYTNSDCSTGKMNWESEIYSSSTGVGYYWANIVLLSHLTDTTFYLCYGDPGITTDQSNKTAVWDSNFVGVYHLPNGSTLTANDSTSRGHNGTLNNSPGAITGQIDGGASFNGSNTGIDISSSTDFDFTNVSSFTVSMWFKAASWSTETTMLAKMNNSSPFTGLSIDYGFGSSPQLIQLYFINNFTSSNYLGAGSNANSLPADGNWHQVVVVYSGKSIALQGVRMYIDGTNAAVNTEQDTLTASPVNTVDMNMGTRVGGNNLLGNEDEVKISNIARTAEWISDEYASQSSPSTFYSIGAEQLVPKIANPGAIIQGSKVKLQGKMLVL